MTFIFLVFMKTFDSVHREVLWKILWYYGIPAKMVKLIKALYDESACCIRTESRDTEWFKIIPGVRSSCVQSPFLFCIVIDFVMRRTVAEDTCIVWAREKRRHLDFTQSHTGYQLGWNEKTL